MALVIGVPMDFRLGFGGSFGEDTQIVVADVAEPARAHPRAVEAELYGALGPTLDALREAAGSGAADGRPGWPSCAGGGRASARPSASELEDDRAPLHPLRIYRELAEVLDRDAVS